MHQHFYLKFEALSVESQRGVGPQKWRADPLFEYGPPAFIAKWLLYFSLARRWKNEFHVCTRTFDFKSLWFRSLKSETGDLRGKLVDLLNNDPTSGWQSVGHSVTLICLVFLFLFVSPGAFAGYRCKYGSDISNLS